MMQHNQALTAFATYIPEASDDEPMIAEAWNNYTDSLRSDGEITMVQYNNWTYEGEEDDDDLIGWHLDKMDVTLSATFLPASDPKARDDMINHMVTIRRGTTDILTTRYSQGIALHGDPDLNDVMYSLLSDIQSADEDFEDWAIEYGYDTDSRKAYAMWEECQHTARCFRRAFSADELEMLHTLFEDY